MLSARQCYCIFQQSVDDYHQQNRYIDAPSANPYPQESFEALLYLKNWIDTVQWHLEDLIRKPDIDPFEGLQIKRRIDKLNQDRTQVVESMDDYFFLYFKNVKYKGEARINSESPAWLLDRMSILTLKIYHVQEQVDREDASKEHISRCESMLSVLLEQKNDMQIAFDELIEDIHQGNRKFKVYRQMKMYNDNTLNPILYQQEHASKS